MSLDGTDEVRAPSVQLGAKGPPDQHQALLRQTELSLLGGSVSNLPKLKRANSRGKIQSPAWAGVSYEDDGTASSCSFIVLPQRTLPQPPSQNPLSAEETYSNLTFPKRAPEVFYEPVAMKDEEPERSCEPPEIPEGASGGVQEDQAVEAAYARVWKGKRNTNQGGPEAGASLSHPERRVSIPQALQVQDMYSVVCKNRKKAATNGKGLGGARTPPAEANQGNCCMVAAGDQESGDEPGRWSSSLESPMIEPCYESVSCGSWAQPGRKETTELAYETVDVHWENSRRKEKSKKKAAPAENLYESIENVAFKCQNLNTASRFEL
ncbi:hypothetical protein JRQ81_014395 [Phrynocephalus forsythii]|uniref:Uncharacterized protein n=1 Tax=Phrynocephalus forsythii TaxID=171643 RepID=A0A9Q0XYJ3_9SAUR|nr:hypothetical protein JRQ81_014395 [Phrynocephalus forsythii]